ncbi:thymidine kinase 2 [Striga asiatica]|uniref:Thymidine kinase 2 n=1 Tax=Striga asiatica TaxID=4170 RepID=A0A5A7QCJ1_STRAF|nr:thymidine kinase 2 [Striga asiatica]
MRELRYFACYAKGGVRAAPDMSGRSVAEAWLAKSRSELRKKVKLERNVMPSREPPLEGSPKALRISMLTPAARTWRGMKGSSSLKLFSRSFSQQISQDHTFVHFPFIGDEHIVRQQNKQESE